ncbi:phosphotransferase family protein [Ferrimicrobium acidiphilum]|uniref:phosphotransferase family protein n=1 Tax=Ferrimicrobium acidiphilum TaxID=121039 RepID=UPI0023F3EF33|nr:phosphotransferase family protein [Ferrimicrobium acidiphilum]
MAEYDRLLSPKAHDVIRDLAHLAGDLRVELCPGGRSNLTYRIEDTNSHSVILRRPPQGMVLPTAHDMAREFRFLSALSPAGFPVPSPIALCEDLSILGAPFYLMDEAKGLILRDQKAAKDLSVETRSKIGSNLITTLAQLHSYDPSKLGLTGGADPFEYLARQLDRWLGQIATVNTFSTALIETVTRVGNALRNRMPTTDKIGVVHGDYRLDNVVVSADGDVVAVLDWEIASVGDPLADIGMLGVYWMNADDNRSHAINGTTKLEGFASREELYDLYGSLRQIDPAQILYYQRFGSWKLACILIGVVERYRKGASGGDTSSIDDYPALIDELLEAADPH